MPKRQHSIRESASQKVPTVNRNSVRPYVTHCMSHAQDVVNKFTSECARRVGDIDLSLCEKLLLQRHCLAHDEDGSTAEEVAPMRRGGGRTANARVTANSGTKTGADQPQAA